MASLAAMRISSICVYCIVLFFTYAYGQLSPSFYDKTCPQALSIVNSTVLEAILQERRMGASLLRLHFHDCFVNVYVPSHFTLLVYIFHLTLLCYIPGFTFSASNCSK